MIGGPRRSCFSFCAQKGKAGKAEEFCKDFQSVKFRHKANLPKSEDANWRVPSAASSYNVGWRMGWRSGLAGQEACRTDVNYNVLSFGFGF